MRPEFKSIFARVGAEFDPKEQTWRVESVDEPGAVRVISDATFRQEFRPNNRVAPAALRAAAASPAPEAPPAPPAAPATKRASRSRGK